MIALSDDHVRFLSLQAQRLAPSLSHNVASVAQIVQVVCGIQAQDASAATLSVRVRSTGLVATDIEQARVQERSIIRTWGPRGTLHLLATEDLGWLLPLLGPVFVAGDRRRREELGLDEDTCALGITIIRNVLANQGPLTRTELVEQLAACGLQLEGDTIGYTLARIRTDLTAADKKEMSHNGGCLCGNKRMSNTLRGRGKQVPQPRSYQDKHRRYQYRTAHK